jgi:hypothetical protein
MALWFHLNVNAERLGTVEIQRRVLDLTDPAAIQDAVCTYDVSRDGRPVDTVTHRYGDGAMRLVAIATDPIASTDRQARLAEETS